MAHMAFPKQCATRVWLHARDDSQHNGVLRQTHHGRFSPVAQDLCIDMGLLTKSRPKLKVGCSGYFKAGNKTLNAKLQGFLSRVQRSVLGGCVVCTSAWAPHGSVRGAVVEAFSALLSGAGAGSQGTVCRGVAGSSSWRVRANLLERGERKNNYADLCANV